MNENAPFVWSLEIEDLPPGGQTLARVLDEGERAALARHAGIPAVNAFAAKGEIRPWADGYALTMRFEAAVIQTCVVTLEPVEAVLEETLIRRYLPADHPDLSDRKAVEVGPDDEDPPEPLEGAFIDLASCMTEAFILALDPYPRTPGAVLPQEVSGEQDKTSPFAILARLKDKM